MDSCRSRLVCRGDRLRELLYTEVNFISRNSARLTCAARRAFDTSRRAGVMAAATGGRFPA
jgi:hypothetical protein